jgi:SAM-dependent methyltransferase
MAGRRPDLLQHGRGQLCRPATRRPRETVPAGGVALFAEVICAADGGLVADVGCGPGHITACPHELGISTFGIDLSPAMIDVARRDHPGLRFEVGSMTGLRLARTPRSWGARLVVTDPHPRRRGSRGFGPLPACAAPRHAAAARLPRRRRVTALQSLTVNDAGRAADAPVPAIDRSPAMTTTELPCLGRYPQGHSHVGSCD